ncbi:MAG: YbjN domain-containing protein [Candidatus Sericytochromatia bacterium]|nr:YbjN domain-containing protein [Candidatus Sericytochromatia bacterium]
MATVAERIDRYFIELDWTFERIDDTLWRTSFPGDLQVHDVFVSADEPGWVSFRSPVCTQVPEQAKPALYERLLRLNALIPMTKFCVMEGGAVFAMIDLPTAELDYSEFRTAVQTLVNHADAHDNEIYQLCGMSAA